MKHARVCCVIGRGRQSLRKWASPVWVILDAPWSICVVEGKSLIFLSAKLVTKTICRWIEKTTCAPLLNLVINNSSYPRNLCYYDCSHTAASKTILGRWYLLLIRRQTFRLYPNKIQTAALFEARRLHAYLYNACRAHRKTEYERFGKSVSYFDQQNCLPAFKNCWPEYKYLHSQTLQATVKRVDLAYTFFPRVANTSQVQVNSWLFWLDLFSYKWVEDKHRRQTR